MVRRFFALLLFCVLSAAPAFAGFDEGRLAYDKGHWIQAIINLRPLAESGDARAMILLGNMYLEGHGVGQDTKEAFGLYHSAAISNNTDGMVAVATLYQTGNGVPANVPLAVGWFERAARMGNMDAALVYAIHMYQGSHGKSYDIKPDHAASYRWFKIVTAHSSNKKQVKAAEFSAGRIEKTLTNDELIAARREIDNWKAQEPADLGPNPEEKFVSDFNAKRKDGAAPDEKKDAADKKTDEKSGNKKPVEKKPDDKSGGADVKPDDRKADEANPDDKKPAADKKPEPKKTDGKKPADDTSSDDDMGR